MTFFLLPARVEGPGSEGGAEGFSKGGIPGDGDLGGDVVIGSSNLYWNRVDRDVGEEAVKEELSVEGKQGRDR